MAHGFDPVSLRLLADILGRLIQATEATQKRLWATADASWAGIPPAITPVALPGLEEARAAHTQLVERIKEVEEFLAGVCECGHVKSVHQPKLGCWGRVPTDGTICACPGFIPIEVG